MAPRVQLRINRQAARSYREESFDEDEADENFVESDINEELDDYEAPVLREAVPQDPVAYVRPSARQSRKAKVSYREASDEEDDRPASSVNNPLSSRKRKHPAGPSCSRRSPSKHIQSRKKRKMIATATPLQPLHAGTSSKRTESTSIFTDGKIPKWTSLPYHILFQIFYHATRLHPGGVRCNPASATALVGVALLNKAWLEPALAALYYCPPIGSGVQAFRLLALLSSAQRERHIINYNTKVRALEIEPETLIRTTPGHGVFNLAALVPHTPQVQRINVASHTNDRASVGRPRVQNEIEVFEALKQHNILLSFWHFSAWWRFDSRWPDYEDPKLVSAGLTGFLQANPRTIADCLEKWPAIRRLTIQKCEFSRLTLQKLPQYWSRLNFIDCDSLESADLDNFLISHGKSLVELVLNHNRNLSLSFLTKLRMACPKLEILSIDLMYYSTLQSTNDIDIGYDSLLLPDEEPSWPSSLQHLEILHLRKWSSTAAENFFSSIVESSRTLSDLRRIVISASIHDLGWRQRLDFRNTWETKLKRVFLRKSQPPKPTLMSLTAYRLWKEGKQRDHPVVVIEKGSGNGRLATPQQVEKAGESRRLRSKAKASEPSEESDTPQALSSLRDRVLNVLEDHIQGMCDVVDVRIDNLRPREQQLDESNFLDSERSGDEDYVDGQLEYEEE